MSSRALKESEVAPIVQVEFYKSNTVHVLDFSLRDVGEIMICFLL